MLLHYCQARLCSVCFSVEVVMVSLLLAGCHSRILRCWNAMREGFMAGMNESCVHAGPNVF